MMMRHIIEGGAVVLLSIANLGAVGSDLRLVEAVKNGDTAAMRSLVEQHVDVNARQADGATALAWAAYRDSLDAAELLIRAGANVNAANDYGATALWLACAKGSAAMTEKLLNAGADPNANLLSGETPLMTAARMGSVDVMKLLLAHGANVNAKETRGAQTALMWAVAEKHAEAARVMIEHGADIHARSKRGFTPLLFAAQQGDVDSARILLAAGADVNGTAPGMSPLLIATTSGHAALSVFLLEKGADPNAQDSIGLTVLYHAASRRNMQELVKALLPHGVNPNSRLAKNLPNPNGQGDYALNMTGATPLLFAASVGNADVVRLLVASGANPLIATEENTTPLMVASGLGDFQDSAQEEEQEYWKRSHVETAKLLVELGSDVNAVGERGWTALHGAAYMGLDDVVQLLVDKGAKMDVMDNFGQTPLSIAEGVITVGLENENEGVARPRNIRKSTSDLLLKLGATPLAASGVQILVKKAK